jgi:hypothetical protein
MALSTLAGLWLCSLLLSGALGWFLGRWPRALSTLFASWRQANRPAARGPAALPFKQEPARHLRSRRPHIFDDMPPVEWVRAQARMILEAESVWELPELCEELYLGHATRAVQRSGEQGEHAAITPQSSCVEAEFPPANRHAGSAPQSASSSTLV